ncbi:helix-turn-helix domain-containing protein [Vibrio brasiliensis]|uniref:helix-turn-helix domain-containing protein n=1 Tax=Vibrio brasiliensis TaxID=170652 RepID=UPI001EFE6671|nr:helix-turn-helix domain-containing protein [Vibrio brasiliensis]MCG9785404.1 helix-turn-helix domain-containing protein [Vibrio brasiliensis]
MTSKQITLPLNATEAADYFEVSRNTVAKAIKQHKLKPVKTKGKTAWYEAKDLSAVLVKPKHTVRTDRNTFESHELKLIGSIKAEFEGDMKQFHAYQQALQALQKRRTEAGLLTEAETVIAVVGSVYSRVNRLVQKMPTEVEKICEHFTREHAAEFEAFCQREVRSLMMDAQEMADDAEQRIRDRSDGD